MRLLAFHYLLLLPHTVIVDGLIPSLISSLIPRLTYQLSVVIGTAALEKLSAGFGEGPESGGEVVCTGQCHIVQ